MEERNKDGVRQETTEMVMRLDITGQVPFLEEQKSSRGLNQRGGKGDIARCCWYLTNDNKLFILAGMFTYVLLRMLYHLFCCYQTFFLHTAYEQPVEPVVTGSCQWDVKLVFKK